jgi:hypothetical protein
MCGKSLSAPDWMRRSNPQDGLKQLLLELRNRKFSLCAGGSKTGSFHFGLTLVKVLSMGVCPLEVFTSVPAIKPSGRIGLLINKNKTEKKKFLKKPRLAKFTEMSLINFVDFQLLP